MGWCVIPHFHGTFTARLGEYEYVGAWSEDEAHGEGIMTYTDGRPTQKGAWVKGEFAGK